MRVVVAPRARADLQAIADFIASDNPARAESFAVELLTACLELADKPLAYPARPDLGTGLRARFHRSYAIIYRVDPGQVSVVRIVHGARNLELLMLGDLDTE